MFRPKIITILLTFFLSASVLLGFTVPVVQASAPASINTVCSQSSNTNESAACNDQNKTDNPITGPNGVLTKVTQILVYIIGIASVIVIIIGGLRYILSNGDANTVNTAKNSIIYALVGLVIAILAQTIVTFVLGRL